jgi:hypothetical protein
MQFKSKGKQRRNSWKVHSFARERAKKAYTWKTKLG